MQKQQDQYTQLLKKIEEIVPADTEAMAKAKARQDSLAKPPESLGRLEEISIKLAGMTGKIINKINQTCVIVFCADNGVVSEGVASAPQSVTMAQTINFTRRLTGVGALCKSYDSELLIVDMGVRGEIPQAMYTEEFLQLSPASEQRASLCNTTKIVNRRIRMEEGQTDNIAKGAAMTEAEAVQAILVGFEAADALKAADFEIAGIGEMGIGNTTTSAALLSAIAGRDSSDTVGRGGGVNDKGFARKKEIVDEVSRKYRHRGGILTIAEDLERIDRIKYMINAMAEVGGFDICAMAGAFLGAANNRMPVVIDGYISAVAALAAYVINPTSADYMIASHKSHEKGYKIAVDILDLKPFMALDMRLGEGSGCPVAFKIIEGACDVMANMATFEEAAINDSYLREIRRQERFRK